jgi:hypothetical protein
MALPTNPLAKVGSAASSAYETALKEVSNFTNSVTGTDKDPLASLTNDLNAGVGSGLNGFASGVSGFPGIGDFGAQASVIGGTAGTALGNAGAASTVVGGATATGQSALGAIGSSITKGFDNIASGVTNLFKSAAGQVDDLLSKKRGKNVPKGAELFNPAGQGIELTPAKSNDWRVRLNADWTIFPDSVLFDRLWATGGVVWPYLPTVSISTSANYTQVDPTHNNYPFQSYKNSQVNDISISGEFSCETEADAEYWIAATLFFKTATKMFFGQGENAGNPPIVCTLSGYGTSIFDNVPVVIKSFSVDLPPDVNYVNYNGANKLGMPATNTWVPVLSTISVTVTPIYNRERLRKFSLRDYANGQPSGGTGFI